jgi:glyoxylase-like metal-dependent hydrolase (beta-lactamase superfamily II)
MKYKHFIFNRLGVNAFVVYDDSKEAIIIDGAVSNGREFLSLNNFIESEKLIIKYIISTHGHFDHVCGNADLKEKYNVPILMHEADNYWVKSAKEIASNYGIQTKDAPMPDKYINDDDKIQFGKTVVDVFLVPGHSPGSVVLYIKELGVVFSGDTLFEGSIGRTDFSGGDHDTLINSIKRKIFTLPVETIVFPGHGDKTTVEIEIGNNEYFRK